jgi:capsular polysaccharide biosynthesis protein
MELTEAGRRIFGQHRRLIFVCVLCVLLGIGMASLARGGAKTYTASARLVLDTQDPQTRSEATSIVDTAKAIGTSPFQVRAALRDAHVSNRDPLDFAKNHVSIGGLGTSAVLQLSVSDRDPRVATAVANALAARVIRARLSISSGELQQVLGSLDQRIEALTTKTANLDSQIDSLSAQLAIAGSGYAADALRARRDAATRSRDSLSQQRSVLEAERVSLISSDALRPKPSIISPATVPTHANGSHWLTYAVLGTLLGLLLGVGVAGLMEMFRPTLVGGDILARELDTPLLGILPNAFDRDASALPAISARLRLAAKAAGVENVRLLPAVPELDLGRLAARLEMNGAGAANGEHAAVAIDAAPSTPGIRPFSLQEASADTNGAVGLVLVSPDRIKKADLLDTGQLLSLTSVPLLGLVAYDSRPVRRPAAARTEVPPERPAAEQP